VQPQPESRTAPAAFDESLRPLLAGSPAPARVVVVTPTAAYAAVRRSVGSVGPVGPAGSGGQDPLEILALLSSRAVRFPGGVLPAVDADDLLARLRPGAVLVVDGGGVHLEGLRLVPARWWDSTVGRIDVPTPAPGVPRYGAALPALPDAVRPGTRALAEVLAAGAAPRHALDHAAGGLVGLGPGLTPAGDDVVAGALVALAAAGATRSRDRLAAAVRPLLDRTTVVSAALLRHAAGGRAIPEVARYVTELASSVAGSRAGRDAVGAVGQDLLRVGASSGIALAHGARIGLRAAGVPVPNASEAV